MSAVVNDALEARRQRDQKARRLWREATEHADPDKVARMLAHVEAQARSGACLARVMTRRCTSVSEIFSPDAWQASRSRRQSLYTTRAHPNARASACC